MDKIGICGGGLIGASWALGFSSNKYKVFVYDNSKKVREEFLNTVKSSIELSFYTGILIGTIYIFFSKYHTSLVAVLKKLPCENFSSE